MQLAPLRGGPLRSLQPTSQNVQFGLAHAALEPQQQPVVDVRQVVDPVAVHQQRVRQPGQLQPGEVRRGPGQAGHLQPEDRPDLAQTDLRHQPARTAWP